MSSFNNLTNIVNELGYLQTPDLGQTLRSLGVTVEVSGAVATFSDLLVNNINVSGVLTGVQGTITNFNVDTLSVTDTITSNIGNFANLSASASFSSAKIVSDDIKDSEGNPYVRSTSSGGSVTLGSLQVTGDLMVNSLSDDQGNQYLEVKDSGQVVITNLAIDKTIEIDTVISDDIQTTNGDPYLYTQDGKAILENIETSTGEPFIKGVIGTTGTGRSDTNTIRLGSDVFTNMAIDGDFVQYNGTMRGDGRYLSSFAERQNASLETRLADFAKASDRRIYVSALDGDDSNHGRSQDKALKTIRKACELAMPKTTIFVASGDYYEITPIYVRRNVSIIGDNLRTVFLYTKSWENRKIDPEGRGEQAVPHNGVMYNKLDYFHVESNVYLYGLRFMNLQAPGFCVAFPSAISEADVLNGKIFNPQDPTSSKLPILYSPDGYFSDDLPRTGPFYEWTLNQAARVQRYQRSTVTQILVSVPGSGYSVDTQINVARPDVMTFEPNAGRRAKAEVQRVDAQGGIVSVRMIDEGYGYDEEAFEQRDGIVEIKDVSGTGAVLRPVFTNFVVRAWSEEANVKQPAGRAFVEPSSSEITSALLRGISQSIADDATEFDRFARFNPGAYFSVSDLILSNQAEYQTKVATWVTGTYPDLLSAAQLELCKRDVGLIVQAVAQDLRDGGYNASLRAARKYRLGGASILSEGTVEPTSRAIDYLNQLVTRTLRDQLFRRDPVVSFEGYESTRVYKSITGDAQYDASSLYPDAPPPALYVDHGVAGYQANVSIGAEQQAGQHFAMAESLRERRDEIQTYVAEFVNEEFIPNTVPSTILTKCRRDVGYIVNALAEDLERGGCLRTVEAANAYFEGARGGRVFNDTQIDPTVRAIRELKTWIRSEMSSLSGVDDACFLLDTISMTIRVPVRTTGVGPHQSLVDAGANNAGGMSSEATALTERRADIQENIVRWVQVEYPGVLDSTTLAAKCSRDVGFLVDAVAHDLRYGGNRRTVEPAVAYFEGVVTVFEPDSDGLNRQLQYTREAILRLKEETKLILGEGNTASDIAQALFQGVADTLASPVKRGGVVPTFGTEAQTDQKTYPVAATAIRDNRASIQADIRTWAAVNVSFLSEEELDKCARDVGFIVDAVADDFEWGGYVSTAHAAKAYYDKDPGGADGDLYTVRLIAEEQLQPTIDAIQEIETELKAVLTATTSVEAESIDRVGHLLSGIRDTLSNPRTIEFNDVPFRPIYVAYKLYGSNLIKWRLEASNDGSMWDVLDERDYTPETSTVKPSSGVYGIEVSKQGAYRTYRLIMLQNSENRIEDRGRMSLTRVAFLEPELPDVYVDGPDTQDTLIRSVEVIDGGSGYASVPDVQIVNADVTATPIEFASAFAEIEDGSVVRITVTKQGQGYLAPRVIIDPPSGVGGRTASAIPLTTDDYAEVRASAIDPDTGRLTELSIVKPGWGYTSRPTISIPPPRSKRPFVTASPYVQNCSNISGPWTRPVSGVEPYGARVFESHPLPFPLDDVYQDDTYLRSIDVNGSGGGIRIDGACPADTSPLRSFVVDAFTQVNQGGVGFLLINRAYAQFVSTFGTFCSTHMKALGGSFANASNSVTDFGTVGLEARGYWPIPYTRAKVIEPDDTWKSGRGMFVAGRGYRSELIDVKVVSSQVFDRTTDTIWVELDPPDPPVVIEGHATAIVDGTPVGGFDLPRKVVQIDNDTYIDDDGNIAGLVLEPQSIALGYGQDEKQFRGSGYRFPPSGQVFVNEIPIDRGTVEFSTILSNVSTVRIAVLEGRKPDFLSITRIHGSWYTVQGVSEVTGKSGVYDVTFFPSPPYVDLDLDLEFHLVSYLSTGSHVMEYVGSGITYNALPEYGGQPNGGNEILFTPPAKVFYTTSDQLGNSNVGPLFRVEQSTGNISLNADSFDLTNLAGLGPFVRNGVAVGQKIREVSANVDLRSSTGAPDAQTVPTQTAVVSYVQKRAVPEPTTADSGKFLRVNLAEPDDQGRRFEWQDIDLNNAIELNIQRVSLSADVMTGMYIDGDARVYGTTTTGQLTITTPGETVDLRDGALGVQVDESGDPPELIFRYRKKDGSVYKHAIAMTPE